MRNFVVRGSLRLTLGPLLGDLPVVGAARLSLLGVPVAAAAQGCAGPRCHIFAVRPCPPPCPYGTADFSYSTVLLGGNVFVVPGLEAWIKRGLA